MGSRRNGCWTCPPSAISCWGRDLRCRHANPACGARAAKTVEEARCLALHAGVRGLGVVCNAVGRAPGDLIVFGACAVGLRAGGVGAGILGASPVPVFAVAPRPARR